MSPGGNPSHRASSPVGNSSPNPNNNNNNNQSRYSLGGGKQSSDAMMRMAQEQAQQHGVGGANRSPSLGANGQLPGTPRGLRPSSEMLHMAAQQQGTPEGKSKSR